MSIFEWIVATVGRAGVKELRSKYEISADRLKASGLGPLSPVTLIDAGEGEGEETAGGDHETIDLQNHSAADVIVQEFRKRPAGLPSRINIHFGRRIRNADKRAGFAALARSLADEIQLEMLLGWDLRNGAWD